MLRWCSQAFAERLLALGEKVIGRGGSGPARRTLERHAHDEKVALQLLEQGLRAARLRPEELPLLPGSEPRKVALACAIWEQTTVSMACLAEHLAMRGAANASQQSGGTAWRRSGRLSRDVA